MLYGVENFFDPVHRHSQLGVGAELRLDVGGRQWVFEPAARMRLIVLEHRAVIEKHFDMAGKVARIVDGRIEFVAHSGGQAQDFAVMNRCV